MKRLYCHNLTILQRYKNGLCEEYSVSVFDKLDYLSDRQAANRYNKISDYPVDFKDIVRKEVCCINRAN
tara:strand:+ start:74693 stop:74899 length:207 start_codon:yes stop_codon:yes gene_type:complete